MKKIAVVPGDGIGIEVTREAVAVLETLRKRRQLLIDLVLLNILTEHLLLKVL